MLENANREFDIVVFGATGYTGEYVVEELAKVSKGSSRKWAVAGRNKQKLKASLEKVQQYLEGYTGEYVVEELAEVSDESSKKWAVTGRNKQKLKATEKVQQNLEGIDVRDIPIIEADVSDESSIVNMCRRTRLVLNCVGPYKLYGEIVVKACVENGTHHVDLSGEMKYLETVQGKYFGAAREKNIYVVQACGFDSIPSDYGVALLKNRFPGELNSVEMYFKISSGSEGRVTNIGTWASAVHSIKDVATTRGFPRAINEIFDKKLPLSKFGTPFRFPLFRNREVGSWCTRFIGPDERVMRRTQMFEYQFLNKRPVHVTEYVAIPSFFSVFYGVFFAISVLFSFFACGRRLLEKYPSFFTGGMFSKEGPTRAQVEGGTTKFTLFADGWTEKLPDPTDKYLERPNKKMKLVINGPEPAYALTSICMVHSGLTILEDTEKLPLNGGVLTPGAAFAETSLQQRLEERGITFEFIE